MPADPWTFPRRKLRLAATIMGAGMLLALAWNYANQLAGSEYPDTTFLFLPKLRFTDLSDALFIAHLPRPYDDPGVLYFPAAWLFLRPFHQLPLAATLVLFVFASLASLTVLLDKILEPLVSNPWKRISYSLLLLGFTYPLLACIDRGNIEMILVPLAALFIYFMSRHRHLVAMYCLLPAICFKLYPAFLLVLLIRERRIALAAGCLGLVLVIEMASMWLLSLPLATFLDGYRTSATYYLDWYIHENHSLEGSASLWNCYKVVLIILAHFQLIAPVHFDFGNSLIANSYTIYSIGFAAAALLLVTHVCLIEKEFLRCAALLLLFMALSTPPGADYRLLYAGLALAILVLLKSRRPRDLAILLLVSLTMVPKKEIFLPFVGKTETGFADVSIQVLLNPVFVLLAISFLVYDGWKARDLAWSRLRLSRLLRALHPAWNGSSGRTNPQA